MSGPEATSMSMRFGCSRLKERVSDRMSREAKLAMDMAKQDAPWKLCPIDESETGSSGYISESPDPSVGKSRLTKTAGTGRSRIPKETGTGNSLTTKDTFTGSDRLTREAGTGNSSRPIKDVGTGNTGTTRAADTGNSRSLKNENTPGRLRFLDVYEKESVPRLTGDITKQDSNPDTPPKRRSLCGDHLACAMESVETVVYGEKQDGGDADDTVLHEKEINKSLEKCLVWMIVNNQNKKET
ncbi:uncharacterized protein LOC121390220 [Gigantopelta aegis]|uniref:uncharacterized protein LOC121390220 n=1 Tax=Gigantopelta aegis TaxID=1735272 RepID=UPI001B88E0E5|nr:uncharacterized protein LOC121390220 [Gigantopelta aegis]